MRPLRLGTGPVRWVLLPGILGSAAEWAPLGSPRPGTAALAFDLPRGDSLDDLARQLLPALPAAPVTVVGASLGGLVGAALSCLQPDRVHRLVCVGSLPGPHARPRLLRGLAHVAHRMPPGVWRWTYARHLHRDLRDTVLSVGAREALIGAAPDGPEWAGRFALVGRWGLPARLPVRVDAVVGRRSRWARAAPFGAAVHWVDGGHRPHLEAPEGMRVLLRSLEEPG